MPVIILAIHLRLDGTDQVADLTFQLAGKPAQAGPGGSNQFTVYGIPTAAIAGLKPGDTRTLTLTA